MIMEMIVMYKDSLIEWIATNWMVISSVGAFLVIYKMNKIMRFARKVRLTIYSIQGAIALGSMVYRLTQAYMQK